MLKILILEVRLDKVDYTRTYHINITLKNKRKLSSNKCILWWRKRFLGRNLKSGMLLKTYPQFFNKICHHEIEHKRGLFVIVCFVRFNSWSKWIQPKNWEYIYLLEVFGVYFILCPELLFSESICKNQNYAKCS